MIYLILLCLIFVAEAYLEKIVIDLKNGSLSDYIKLNKQEHFRSAIYSALVILSFCLFFYHLHFYFLIVNAIIARRIFFDYVLILVRNRPNKGVYEGTDTWVKIFSTIFGKRGRNIELLVSLAIFILFIVLHLTTQKSPWQ